MGLAGSNNLMRQPASSAVTLSRLDTSIVDMVKNMFAVEKLEFSQLLLGQDEEVNISMAEANENLLYSSDALNSHCMDMDMDMDIPSVEEMCAFSLSLADIMMEDSARLHEDSNGDIPAIINPQHQPCPLDITGNQTRLKREFDQIQGFPGCAEDQSNPSAENQKRKPSRTRRNAHPKKSHKPIPNANVEEDSASQDMNCGVASSSNASAILHSNCRTRANKGSATDPQSLYARKRRERINERLRILQNLVPNGTKVDISTMLEEAVHYVKFLQLQIKLLSSDDHWMYAPIAYNGMDMGLTFNISKTPSTL